MKKATVADAQAVLEKGLQLAGGGTEMVETPSVERFDPFDLKTAPLQPQPDQPDVTPVEAAATATPEDAPPAPDTAPAPVAAAAPDPWSEYEEIEYEDADLGEKFRVRAPKTYAEKVRNGYLRRSVMDRNNRYLNEARPVLEPLITSGQFRVVQPFIDLALRDQEYAQFLSDSYQRRLTGQPLRLADAAAEAAAQARRDTAPAQPQVSIPQVDEDDPYLAPVVKPLVETVQTLQQQLAEQQRWREQQEQQARQAALQQQQRQENAWNILRSMRAGYPQDFNGNQQQEQRVISEIYRYANDAGIFQRYGETPAAIELAYLQMTQARQTATASPAAAAQVEAEARRRAAEETAAAVAPGRPATPSAPAPPPKITTRHKDGRMKSATELAREVERKYLAR